MAMLRTAWPLLALQNINRPCQLVYVSDAKTFSLCVKLSESYLTSAIWGMNGQTGQANGVVAGWWQRNCRN
jgi:hypothetical protein